MDTPNIPDVLPMGMDEERFLEMEVQVQRVMHMNAEGKMAEPINTERGSLTYFCKNPECKENVGSYTLNYDPETSYQAPICPSCQSTHVSIGTKESIHSHFRIKP